VIEKIVYFSFFLLKKKLFNSPIFLYFEALERVKAVINLKIYKSKKGKGIKLNVIPFVIGFKQQYIKAINWLVFSVKSHNIRNLMTKIFYEFYCLLYLKTSIIFNKKKEFYKYATKFKISKKFKW
jgi:ribosomal protein S7